MTNPTQACGGRPFIRNDSPTLNAVLTDLDGGNLQAKFWIYDVATGALVWDPALGGAQASGQNFSIVVPSGLLLTGRVYQWRVQAKDDRGATSAYVPCEFIVDTSPPAVPHVTSSLYPNDGGAYGGAGQAGSFTFSDSSTDVIGYNYSFDDPNLGSVAGGAVATVPGLNWSAGPHTLFVQAFDQAGNPSARLDYEFEVDFGGINGAWSLDDGSGTEAQDVASEFGATATPHPLRLGAGVQWADGPLGQRPGLPRDWALRFTGNASGAQAASTDGHVVSTNESFSVMATVWLDQTAAVSTAVSQDDGKVSGFELGYRQGASCPGGTGGCWAFSRPMADAAGAENKVAVTSLGAQVGSWVHLTGVYDVTGRQLRLYACQVGTSTATVSQAPIGSAWVAFAPLGVPNAHKNLTVGRGQAAGSPAHGWTGRVADVHVYDGVVDEATVRAACQGPR